MSRKKIVAGNWKMNMTIDESNDLINKLKEVSENNVEIKIAPGMVADLYSIPEVQKKDPPKKDKENKSSFSGIFSKKNK